MRRLRVGDRVVRVRDEGESSKPPLVCVHGAGASSVIFMDTVRRLSPQRRIIAIDLPGHGQSDPWHDTSIETYRDAVGTVCATLKIERAVLVGHSMGGQIALACAAAWPERCAGLVLASTAARIEVAPRVFQVFEKDFANAAQWLARVSWSPATPRDLVERWAGLMLTAEQEIAVADFRAVERWDGAALLAKVRVPSLVMGGADDLLTPPPLLQNLASGLATQAVIVPQAGHNVMLEQPEAWFAEIGQFLLR